MDEEKKERRPEWVGKIRHRKARVFLVAFSRVGQVSLAAKKAHIDRDLHYLWLKREGPEWDEYRKAWVKAQELACENLEDEAYRRAVDGTKRPVYQGGICVGYVQEYSDTLLMFLMKGRKPEMYRENVRIEQTSRIEQTVRVLEDADWYGNANRIEDVAWTLCPPASGNGTSGPAAAEPLQIQDSSVRPPVGQNGHGSNGNGKGPRPGTNGTAGSH